MTCLLWGGRRRLRWLARAMHTSGQQGEGTSWVSGLKKSAHLKAHALRCRVASCDHSPLLMDLHISTRTAKNVALALTGFSHQGLDKKEVERPPLETTQRRGGRPGYPWLCEGERSWPALAARPRGGGVRGFEPLISQPENTDH